VRLAVAPHRLYLFDVTTGEAMGRVASSQEGSA